MTDDEALIRAAQAGSGEAFEELLERHYDTMYRFAYKWCANRPDAEDVTQQACLKLARSLASFRFESAFTTWLYRVVINCAQDWKQAQKRQGSGTEFAAEAGATEGGAVEHRVYLWQLLQQLDAMPAGIKETILLVHAEGLTHAEAADVLNIKESTVSWRLHEFRKNYRLSDDQGGAREHI